MKRNEKHNRQTSLRFEFAPLWFKSKLFITVGDVDVMSLIIAIWHAHIDFCPSEINPDSEKSGAEKGILFAS